MISILILSESIFQTHTIDKFTESTSNRMINSMRSPNLFESDKSNKAQINFVTKIMGIFTRNPLVSFLLILAVVIFIIALILCFKFQIHRRKKR